MAAWTEVIPDVILAVLYSFLLIRLTATSDIYFKTTFYTLFITTGVYSIISVLSFVVMSLFKYTEEYWTAYIFKIAYALNVFGASGATFGKAFIAIHRYYVMRIRDFSEKRWNGSVVLRFIIFQLAISVARTAPVWPASYTYKNGAILSLSPTPTLILKVFSIGSYVLYIFCNGICTAMTCRELAKIRKLLKGGSNPREILDTQRNLFIVVTFVVAILTFFGLLDLLDIVFAIYPIVNGLATYAAPVTLLIVSSKVRKLIFFRNQLSPAVVSIQQSYSAQH